MSSLQPRYRLGISNERIGPCFGAPKCTKEHTCDSCLQLRSRAVERTGRDFPALGAQAHQAVTENV